MNEPIIITKPITERSNFVVTIRFDDECKNGHDTFSITADLYKGEHIVRSGQLIDEIHEYCPEIVHLLKWHLTSTNGGPLHYMANTLYWAKEGNLEYARKSAVWEDATLEQLLDEQQLIDRFPALMDEFRSMIEGLGFTWTGE